MANSSNPNNIPPLNPPTDPSLLVAPDPQEKLPAKTSVPTQELEELGKTHFFHHHFKNLYVR